MNLKINKKALLISAPFIILFFLMLTAVFIVSNCYQEIYGKPRAKDAVMDCAGYNKMSQQQVANPMSGEWEFFYNQWIITDFVDDSSFAGNENQVNETYKAIEPDGTIKLPSRWTGRKINGKRLPKTGYASYRLKIINLENVEQIRVYILSSTISYRVFINGDLVVTEGVVSKSIKEAYTDATRNTVAWYYPEANEELTVVLEISENNQGGLYQTPWFDVYESSATSLSSFINTMPKVLLGGIIVLFLFCLIVPLQLTRKENSFSLPLLLLSLIMHFLVTKDMSRDVFIILRLNHAFVPIIRYITAALLLLSFLYHLLKLKVISASKKETIIFLSPSALAFVGYFLTLGSFWQIIPAAVSLVSMLYIYYKIARCGEKTLVTVIYMLINCTLLTILSLETVDSMGLIIFGLETAFSIGLCILIAVMGLMGFYKMRETQKKLVQTARLEKEIAVVKMQALKAQIKPHFIFNSLSAVQDVYRKSQLEGEEMLSRFSSYLRANVDLDKNDLIPFEKELVNTLNYFELENLRYDGKLNLILNIDFSDFLLPPLSLQPVLENAIKYGYTHEKEDGKIEISAFAAENGDIIIEVSDNGRGYNSANVRPDATGIKNVTERLRYALGATIGIKSDVGIGTIVTIIIPKKMEAQK